jgi:hypothetical protein
VELSGWMWFNVTMIPARHSKYFWFSLLEIYQSESATRFALFDVEFSGGRRGSLLAFETETTNGQVEWSWDVLWSALFRQTAED